MAQAIDDADASQSQFSILCIDFDRFKEVNEVFGHGVADRLLQKLASRLKVASGDAFLARLGGDDFNILVSAGKQPAASEELAKHIQELVFDGFNIDGHIIKTALSIGIAIYPHDGPDAQTLMINADAALARAKRDGRGSLRFFEAEMDKQQRDRLAMQHELGASLERNELRLFFQPQARMDGEITGFEALLRWEHSVRGRIAPNTFIPLAEENGMIIPIGAWVLKEACRQAATWSKPLLVAVNLSPVQFHYSDLPALVLSILLETGLPPHRLELEITEGVLMNDFDRAISVLRRLKALGVSIAMDDFGTGYSSLRYIQAFPFDKLKVDKSFVDQLNQNLQSQAIIRAVVGLAHGLGLPVVAEGVETLDQLEFLKREHCDEVQGYLIGRPQPIEHYADIVGVPEALPRSVEAAG
ncbi:putative bifunctional diguanylate cyclase/phosphodiesterase [Bradyrhizobium sp.]|uniref:putative bifunctional diguanylate cyclase/phosphodiesterase n=1 Tax=Bradyrhizobium sp. TaxID=376 RepID=UPI003C60ABE4